MPKRMLKNKKGQVFSTANTLMTLGLTLIIITVLLMFFNQFNDKFQDITLADNQTKDTVDSFNTKFSQSWNWAAIIIFVGLLIGSAIVAKNTDINITKFVFSLLFIVYLVVALALTGNMWEEMQNSNSNLATTVTSLPVMNFFMDHIVEFGVIYFGVLGVVIFIVRKGE